MPVLLTILAVVCATAVDARAQPVFRTLSLPAAPLIRPWVEAVMSHRPGELDSAALVPAKWNRDEIRHAWIYVQVLAALLRDEKVSSIRVVQGRTTTYVPVPAEVVDALRGSHSRCGGWIR